MFWIIWMGLLLFLFLIPFGWGYRSWGTPYPYYWRRGRGYPEGAQPDAVVVRQEAGWGWLADVLWIVFVVLAVWLVVALIF